MKIHHRRSLRANFLFVVVVSVLVDLSTGASPQDKVFYPEKTTSQVANKQPQQVDMKPANQRQPDTISASITTTWDSRPIDHPAVNLTLVGKGDHVEINVVAPFFNDRKPPCAEEGPCFGLWDYEVVEAFFLAPDNKYIEIELGPWGQHLVLLLDGVRNPVAQELALEYEVTSRDESTKLWTGVAKIPAGYFPPNVDKWNAYAIHEDAASPTGDGRLYESLYPVPQGSFPQPDFHRLDYFQSIAFGDLLPSNPGSELSQVWQDALGLPKAKKQQQ